MHSNYFLQRNKIMIKIVYFKKYSFLCCFYCLIIFGKIGGGARHLPGGMRATFNPVPNWQRCEPSPIGSKHLTQPTQQFVPFFVVGSYLGFLFENTRKKRNQNRIPSPPLHFATVLLLICVHSSPFCAIDVSCFTRVTLKLGNKCSNPSFFS